MSISKLWTPIYVGEGEIIPKWYGCSRWLPYRLTEKEPTPAEGVWKWRRIYYPIPLNMILAAYFWTIYLFKRGFALPPECYRSQVFEVKSHCPHCEQPLYK